MDFFALGPDRQFDLRFRRAVLVGVAEKVVDQEIEVGPIDLDHQMSRRLARERHLTPGMPMPELLDRLSDDVTKHLRLRVGVRP